VYKSKQGQEGGEKTTTSNEVKRQGQMKDGEMLENAKSAEAKTNPTMAAQFQVEPRAKTRAVPSIELICGDSRRGFK